MSRAKKQKNMKWPGRQGRIPKRHNGQNQDEALWEGVRKDEGREIINGWLAAGRDYRLP